jgi:5'-nucleotidase
VYEGAPVEPDAAIEATLAPAIARVAALKAEPLGVVAASVVSIRGEVESPLGNLFTDAMLAGSGGADLAINNTDGGLRGDLPAGPVTYGRLFEVFPFDNQLVRLTMTGRDLERVLAGHFGRSSQLLGLAGGRVEAGCAGGGLSVRIVRASGAEIRDEETVVVATTDYLATTELFDDVRAPDTYVGTGRVVRDVVADWLRRRGGVLHAEALVDARAPRFPPRSTLPIRCWRP